MSANITTKRKLDTLAEMFPALDFVILQSVLDSQKGDLDEAIVALLQMNETTLSVEGEEVEHGVPAQPSRPTLQNYYPVNSLTSSASSSYRIPTNFNKHIRKQKLGTTGKQRRRRNSNNNGNNNNLNLHPNSNSRKEKRKREHRHNPVAAGRSLLDSATASAGRDPRPVLQPLPEDLNDSFPALRLDDSVDFPRLVSPPTTAEQLPTAAASSSGGTIASSCSSLSSAEAMPAPPVLSWRDVLKDMAESPAQQQGAEREEEQSDHIPCNGLSLSEEDRAVVPFSSSSCDDAEGTDDFVMLYEAKNVEEEQLGEEDKQEEEQEKEKEKQPEEEPEPAKEQEVVLPLHPSLTTFYNKEEEVEAEEVAVKLCYENPNKQSKDIHRFRLLNHKKDGWTQLLAHIHNKHPNCQSEFMVQYVDDEEDLITVRSQEELEEAVRVARALSLSLPGGSGGAALVAPFLLRLSVSFCS